MARAETVTKLPLDRWAAIFGINPIHFNQCSIAGLSSPLCEAGWFQADWQDTDRVSRDQLASAIRQAEDNIENYLGFNLMPGWEVEERQAYGTRPLRPELVSAGYDIRGRRSAIQLDRGYFIEGGVEAKTLILQSQSFSWGDRDGDGLNETGVLEVTVPEGSAVCELELYYPEEGGADRWQIRPVAVTLDGTTATFTFKRELVVRKNKLLEPNPRGSNYDDDDSFLSEVDVYRRYNDPSQQATLIWEGCVCGGASCVACATTEATACLRVRDDDRFSFVTCTPATYDADSELWIAAVPPFRRQPDAVRVNYRAGWRDRRLPCPTVEMDNDLANIVAIYAASMLDRKVCDCNGLQEGIGRWQRDLAAGTASNKNSTTNDGVIDCPFGTREGGVEAWRRLKRPGNRTHPINRGIDG